MPLVEDELRRLAHRYMSRERAGHTLQTTALVNEAFAELENFGERADTLKELARYLVERKK